MKKRYLLSLSVFIILFIFASNNTTVYAKEETKETYLSEEIQSYCHEIGNMYCISEELLISMIERESTGNPLAVNGGCIGLLQISERWHLDRMERLGVDDLFDPYSNILVGADYLMELAEKHGDVALVLSIYHGESKAFENHENGIISSYAKGILERSEELERERGK